MFLQPENLTGGEPGQHRVAKFLDRALEAAELGHDRVALVGRGGVAPQLGRANDLPLFVERHEAVLLAAYPDRAHLSRRGLGLPERGADARLGGIDPVGRMLLLGTGRQAVDEAVRLGAFAKYPAVFRIHHQRLGRLRPTIDADDKFSHVLRVVTAGGISQRRRETNTGGVWLPSGHPLIRPPATFSGEGK